MPKVPNIKHKGGEKNPLVDSPSAVFEIPFYKDDEYFRNLDNFVSFVNGTEAMIRTSKYYKRFIASLKEKGLNYCQVLGNIEEKKGVDIEMHHGPVFTLFDYVSIVTEYLLRKKQKVNSFIVSNIVLQEHFDNRIQVVMLSKTVHEQVHAGNVFINLKQAYGDLNLFIRKYRDGISPNQISVLNQYIEKSLSYDSDDKGVLKVLKEVRKWNT